MMSRTDVERRALRAERAASGRKPAQLSALTESRCRELIQVLARDGVRVYGLDELIFELASAELARPRAWRPSVASADGARLARHA